MSRVCDVCGKGSMHGNKVSKSYNHTRRQWRPNLLKVKTEIAGTTRTLNVCAHCLRAGYVVKKINVVPANAGAPKSN
ncbi:MAG: 50S ribosomal protein L28 [Treponema sp.]|nr:50S ribosomal protein L28 [Treponema sp.]